MKTFILTTVAGIALLAGSLPAQVPQLINYQGRIAVGSTNFHGLGQFKFALVGGAGTATYWSNDGTATGGGPPASAVRLTVTNGLYSVLLGDPALTNMTAIPPSVFGHPDVRLSVWFNDGSHGWQQLTPDQRIAAAGYAMMAGEVRDGAITSAKFANGAVGAAQLAAGAVGSLQLGADAVQTTHFSPGAVAGTQLAAGAATANLNASGQAGVAAGGVILSASDNATLVNAGYVKIGTTVLGDHWQEQLNATPPAPRNLHTAVWTGSEMIVWGGWNGSGYLNGGKRYNPASNTWTALAARDAPTVRAWHTAVWTGSEMIVWGGWSGSGCLNDGARYDPAANCWTAVATTGTPAERQYHTAVWTGREMIVWGGVGNSGYLNYLNDGGRYDPTANRWSAVATTGSPSVRTGHTAVWTGSEMIVWGGRDGSSSFNDGGRYDPAGAGAWTAIPNTLANTPGGRSHHTAVWTGSEMIVWGGVGTSPGILDDGGRYNPAGAGTWAAVNTTGAPAARADHTAVWTGSEMIVWGGAVQGGLLNDGGGFDPSSDRWTAVTTSGAPAARTDHTAVWAGSEMIVWGGRGDAGYLNDTWSYTPGKVMVLYQKP
ncbi:MAG: galactose oxidase [Verrucomicrobia bacterium]|nr:galactose oxidase [Verrucomicrobiota bacterium]